MSAADFTRRLNETRREQRWANQRPRDAATVILLDRSQASPRVLMGRRHMGHAFMPGKFVFPGGRVDRCDGSVPAATEPDQAMIERLSIAMKGKPSPRRARALAAAAVRETFEETGIALGLPASGNRSRHADWRAFFDLGLAPDLSALTFIARAITPPRRPRRFDTRFFAIDMTRHGISTEAAMRPSEELEELVWVPIEEARTLDIPTITSVIVEELENRLADDDTLAATVPLPYYHVVRGQFIRETL